MVAGAAVTTAVVTGALLVGDSMRESLRRLTLDRLGNIEQVLLNDRFFEIGLVDRILQQPEVSSLFEIEAIGRSIQLRGSINKPVIGTARLRSGSMGCRRRISCSSSLTSIRVPILFWKKRQDQIFPSVVINEPLQRELGVEVGDDVLLSFGALE